MKRAIVAYIDKYNEITFLVEKKGKYKAKHFYLYVNDELVEELKVLYHTQENNNLIKIGLAVQSKLVLRDTYVILDDLNNEIPVYSGSVVRTTEFESEFYYDGPLGFDYQPTSTIFRLWSPVAHSIFIELNFTDGHIERRELAYQQRGVWFVEIQGDLDGVAYIYYVKLFDDYVRVQDPYAIASNANGEYNYVVNKNKFYKMKYEKPFFSGRYTDAVVYEGSIRDLTYSAKEPYKGTFLGLVNDSKDRGLNYLADLGVTHFQVMPAFDFGGVDDKNKDKAYNWGYNPEQYFVPSGWYSINPDSPYSRINEFLELIDEAHKRGIRVVMDVVFNHVFNIKTFPFDRLVPGYFYRVDQYGNYTNTSGCGNDLATEKRMCSKFIIENLKYWAEVYHIDGFRFDLMGLLDIETLNNAYEVLRQIDPDIMVYGEGWNMPNTIPDSYRPHSYNHYKMPHFAFFNDTYRDFMKGNQWTESAGYVFEKTNMNFDLYHLVGGSCLNQYKFQNPNQTVNYVECHDNYTLFDFATKKLKLTEKEAIDGGRLALQIIAVSMGIVFIHAGEEFYRTKKGVENSYNANDKINCYDYERKQQFADDIKGLKELLEIRKEYALFRMSNAYEIEKRMHAIEELCSEHKLVYCLDGEEYILTIIIKNDHELEEFVHSRGMMIFDAHHRVALQNNVYSIQDPGVYIFKEDK